MTHPKKGARITGADLERLRTKLVTGYMTHNKSIRALADDCGRSYGFVHRLLHEAGVTIRSRGGRDKTSSA